MPVFALLSDFHDVACPSPRYHLGWLVPILTVRVQIIRWLVGQHNDIQTPSQISKGPERELLTVRNKLCQPNLIYTIRNPCTRYPRGTRQSTHCPFSASNILATSLSLGTTSSTTDNNPVACRLETCRSEPVEPDPELGSRFRGTEAEAEAEADVGAGARGPPP